MTDFLSDMFRQASAPPRPDFKDAPAREYRQHHAAVADVPAHELVKTTPEQLRAWWDELSAEDKRDMTELFEMSDECKRVRGLYDRLRAKDVPLMLIIWAKAKAESVGAK